MLPITTLLFPSCPDLLLEEITCEGQTLFLTVRSLKKVVACPDCANVSMKAHSRYTRTLADVSLMDYAVVLRAQLRRFFCSNPSCARQTFVEPFADLAVAHARRTMSETEPLDNRYLYCGSPVRFHETLERCTRYDISRLNTLFSGIRRGFEAKG